MKYSTLFFCTFFYISILSAQQIITLPYDKPKDVQWEHKEKEYFSKIWNTKAVTNVSSPTLTVYKPDPEKQNGTSVIIAPGGGMYALSIESEGTMIAKWLAKKRNYCFYIKI